jgi:hypothetical protein
MTADEIKRTAGQLPVAEGTGYSWLRDLICDGFMDVPVSSADIVHRIKEKFGRRWQTSRVQIYMRKFVGLVHAVKPKGSRTNFWVLTSVNRADAVLRIGKTNRVIEVEHALFAPDLELKLQKNLSRELEELHGTFGRYGNSSAFLLRKILEKLLIICYRKVGKASLIEDKNKPGGLVGLEYMIELAMRERVNSVPMLSGKTGSQVKGAKFLGDTAAHNPLVDVDVEDILPQMPYVVMAYKELALHL